LDENRAARVAFRIAPGKLTDLDYRSIGYFIGRQAGVLVPALVGLPPNVTSDELKNLGAAAASAGPVTMIHYIGLTPGSKTVESAAAGETVDLIDIERTDLDEVEGDLSQTDGKPDLVALGVPHLSISELGYTAKLLVGKKLKSGIKMYVYTSSQAYDLATRSGVRGDIESSGARLTHSTDAEISPLKELGFHTVMTNSAKLAEIVSSEGEVQIRYSTMSRILEEVAE
jgi:predicted aconitase